jgi:hypothetical protein
MAAWAASSLVLLALVFAACGGGDGPRVDQERLQTLVLQPRDLPGFVQFDVGRQVRADANPGPRQEPGRFGRLEGWKARYRRPGSPATDGPLVVESRADLFAAAEGAGRDLDAYRREFEQTVIDTGDRATVLGAPAIGEAATALRIRQQSFPRDSFSFTVAWRYRNVTASIAVNGFAGRIELEDALALARKQQRRIEAAE